MNKLAIAGSLVALVLATPALAGGTGGGGSNASFDSGGGYHQLMRGMWKHAYFSHHGFWSPGRHFGWFKGKHWGWFKPHNPHWPHHPASP